MLWASRGALGLFGNVGLVFCYLRQNVVLPVLLSLEFGMLFNVFGPRHDDIPDPSSTLFSFLRPLLLSFCCSLTDPSISPPFAQLLSLCFLSEKLYSNLKLLPNSLLVLSSGQDK